MKVRVLFFAILRERLKRDEEELEVDKGETVSQLADRILSPLFTEGISLNSILFAVNNEYVSKDYSLKPGDELALIPPVAGG